MAQAAKEQPSKSLAPLKPAAGLDSQPNARTHNVSHKQKVCPAPSSQTKSKVYSSDIDAFFDAYQAEWRSPLKLTLVIRNLTLKG